MFYPLVVYSFITSTFIFCCLSLWFESINPQDLCPPIALYFYVCAAHVQKDSKGKEFPLYGFELQFYSGRLSFTPD